MERALEALQAELAGAEAATGSTRQVALSALASELESDIARSSDASKMRMLVDVVRDLASASLQSSSEAPQGEGGF